MKFWLEALYFFLCIGAIMAILIVSSYEKHTNKKMNELEKIFDIYNNIVGTFHTKSVLFSNLLLLINYPKVKFLLKRGIKKINTERGMQSLFTLLTLADFLDRDIVRKSARKIVLVNGNSQLIIEYNKERKTVSYKYTPDLYNSIMILNNLSMETQSEEYTDNYLIKYYTIRYFIHDICNIIIRELFLFHK